MGRPACARRVDAFVFVILTMLTGDRDGWLRQRGCVLYEIAARRVVVSLYISLVFPPVFYSPAGTRSQS